MQEPFRYTVYAGGCFIACDVVCLQCFDTVGCVTYISLVNNSDTNILTKAPCRLWGCNQGRIKAQAK